MKIYEMTRDMSTMHALRAAADPTLSWTWWIGKARVTAAEIESWQLGPDLTENRSEQDD